MSRTERINKAQHLSGESGVGLIEVLIAILVLSIGVLGLAGLQMNSLKNNQSSMERSLAIVETYSIVEAMRSDRTNALNGNFDIALDDDPSGSAYADEMLTDWRDRLTDVLGPDATGSIVCNTGTCTIIVQWNDSRGIEALDENGADPNENMQITTQVRL